MILSKYKYLILIFAISAMISLVFFSNLEQQNQKKSQESGAAEVSRLLELASAAFEQMTERLATELTRVIETELISSSSNSWLENSSFESLALARPSAGGVWTLEWVKTPLGQPNSFNFTNWISKVDPTSFQQNKLIFRSIQSSNGESKILFGVLLRLKTNTGSSERLGLGVIPSSELTSLLSPLKSNALELFYVDKDGFALSFTDPKYIGSKMDVHPLVAVALKSKSSRNIGPFSDLRQNETLGGFKKSLKTDVTTLVNILNTNNYGQKQSQVFLTISISAILFLGLLIAYIFSTGDRRNLRIHKEQILRLQSQNNNLQSESKNLDIARQASMHWSRSVSGYLRSPVYSLIGELQKLKDKLPANTSSLDFMAKELYKLKDFVEGLSQRADNESAGQNFSLRQKIEEVIFQQRDKYVSRNLSLSFNDAPELFIYGNISDTLAAIDLLLEFFRKEMVQDKTAKSLAIELSSAHGAAEINFISDLTTAPENLEEIMSLQNDRYVNLAVANGLFKSLSGATSIERSLEKIRFKVRIPLAAQKVAELAEPKLEPKLEQKKQPLKKTEDKQSVDLLAKKVNDELDKILPPRPTASDDQEVSVVEDLTASTSQPPSIQIRKPRVRFDS